MTLLPVLPTSQMYSSWSAHVTLGQVGIDAAFSVCIRETSGKQVQETQFFGWATEPGEELRTLQWITEEMGRRNIRFYNAAERHL